MEEVILSKEGFEELKKELEELKLVKRPEIIERIKAGEHYDFVEVMACPGGCVCGAGQPFALRDEKELRGKGLYSADRMSSIKRSEENPLMISLYNGFLKGKVHELLHVRYGAKEAK